MNHRFSLRRTTLAVGVLLLILAGAPRADSAAGGPAANVLLPVILYFFMSLFSGHITFHSLVIAPVAQTADTLAAVVMSLGAVFAQPQQMSGMAGIVVFGGRFLAQGAAAFFRFLLFLSVNLAVFNMLPFPFLDGGKIILCLLEKVHPRAHRLHAPLTVAGLVCLVPLLAYTTVMDVGRIL